MFIRVPCARHIQQWLRLFLFTWTNMFGSLLLQYRLLLLLNPKLPVIVQLVKIRGSFSWIALRRPTVTSHSRVPPFQHLTKHLTSCKASNPEDSVINNGQATVLPISINVFVSQVDHIRYNKVEDHFLLNWFYMNIDDSSFYDFFFCAWTCWSEKKRVWIQVNTLHGYQDWVMGKIYYT